MHKVVTIDTYTVKLTFTDVDIMGTVFVTRHLPLLITVKKVTASPSCNTSKENIVLIASYLNNPYLFLLGNVSIVYSWLNFDVYLTENI